MALNSPAYTSGEGPPESVHLDLAEQRSTWSRSTRRRRSAGSTRRRRRRRRRGSRSARGRRSGRRRSRRGRRRPSRPWRPAPAARSRPRGSARSAPSPTDGDAAVGPGDRRLAGAQLDQLGEPVGEVAAVRELLADQLLGLALVRGDDRGAGAQPGQHRLALGVEDDGDAALAQVLDQARVEVAPAPGRQAAGEHADPRAAGEVVEPLDEALDLLRADRRAALVDLGLLARGRVDHRQVDPRLAGDPGEVGEHRLLAELLEHPGAGRAAGEAGGDHRPAEQAERAGDVDPLAAGDGAALDRAVAVAEAEVRHRDGAVDRGVEGDGEDHCRRPAAPRERRTRAQSVSPNSASASQRCDRSRDEAAGLVEGARLGDRAARRASGTARDAQRRRRRPSPCRAGAAADRALDLAAARAPSPSSRWPRRTPTATRARGAQRQLAARVADRRRGEHLARRGPAGARGRARSRSRAARGCRGRARSRSGAPSTAEISSTPLAAAGADQDVAGVEGVPGLDAGRPRRLEQQVVEGVDPPRRVGGCADRALRESAILREGRDLAAGGG